MAAAVVQGLGKLASPLTVVKLDGETRLLVHPVAALGTDVSLVGISTALFFSTRSVPLKVLSLFGAAWGGVAASVETAKLLSPPEARLREVAPEPVAGARGGLCRACGKTVLLTGRWTGVRCLYCGDLFCSACGHDHFGAGRAWRTPACDGRTMVVEGRRR